MRSQVEKEQTSCKDQAGPGALAFFLENASGAEERWFWSVSFELTGPKAAGNLPSLDPAKAACKTEYENWRKNG